jgi:hypothetical protein
LVRADTVGAEKTSEIFFFAALPHSTTEDDVYKGYFIPKGTIVIGNAW